MTDVTGNCDISHRRFDNVHRQCRDIANVR